MYPAKGNEADSLLFLCDAEIQRLCFFEKHAEKGLTFFIHDLYMKSDVKNTLLNEVLEGNETDDLKKLIKQYKGE